MKIKQFLQIAVLVALAGGVGPAYSAFYQWSKTASSNAGADPTINWAEGMSPSSINDSARAMMARTAEYRDDISGLLTTGGSSTAYTVTTNQTLCQSPSSTTTPIDGQLLSVTVNSTNGVSPTLTADGCNAFPIQSSPGVAVASGTLISGSPYSMRFSTSNSAWMLKGFYASSTNIPLGGMIDYTGVTAPNSNFILPAGQCLSTTTYAAYWALLGSPASGSCPGGQFAVIDKRGRVSAALDNLNGVAANRMTASGCGVALTSVGAVCTTTETFTILTGNLPPYTPSGSIVNGAISLTISGVAAWGGTTVVSVPGGTTVTSAAGGTTGQISISQGSSTLNMSAQGGLSTPIPRAQPTIGVSALLRVL